MCAQQDVGLDIRHRLERNQLVGSVALTAQRWKLGVEECSNCLALGDRHLEIAHGLALSQGVEQMHSEEIVVFKYSRPGCPFRSRPCHSVLAPTSPLQDKFRVSEKAQIVHK